MERKERLNKQEDAKKRYRLIPLIDRVGGYESDHSLSLSLIISSSPIFSGINGNTITPHNNNNHVQNTKYFNLKDHQRSVRSV